jgi:methyl-accepting chemotaxis protein
MQRFNEKKEHAYSFDKMMFSFLGLFILFLVNILYSIIVIHNSSDNIAYIQQELSFLMIAHWVFLIIGTILTTAAFTWWFKRGMQKNKRLQEIQALLDAIYQSQAIIEFDMDGRILNANEKFLDALGYSFDEIVGKHHSIFVEPAYKETQEYKDFWKKLNHGEYNQGEYKRLKKNGDIVWLQSSYNPVLDKHGNPIKVIKISTVVTEQKNQATSLANAMNKLREIGKQIIIDSSEISSGIHQLEAASIGQASSAAEQATSVTEISTTIEEIKTTVQQMLEKAKQLGESATSTNKEAEKGNAAIEMMNDFMKVLKEKMDQISVTILGLNDKTQQISEITETVSDIARQLKMLALNASIEAAKAGEYGKGFTVVAGEVKELAEKSQLSTERVQKILQDIRQTAEHAVIVTEDGTRSVEKNIEQVRATNLIIKALGDVIEESSMASLQIVSAIREESIAIEQIDISMKEVDKVTSLFGSAIEQTKQSIVSLSKVAESLKITAKALE